MTTPKTHPLLVLCVLILLLLTSCGSNPPEPTFTSVSPTQPATPTVVAATPTPLIPSETPIPLAARVNAEAVTLADYQAELARFQDAFPDQAEDSGGVEPVLDYLIDQALLAQAAAQGDFALDEQALQERLDRLAEAAGGEQALLSWMAAYGYTPDSFRLALQRAAAAAWMRDQIAASLPPASEQIHARQVLLYNSDQANEVLAQVQAGTDFATIAERYDPELGGDLGWFPRGYLTEPLIEAAAFALQPGEISAVIETRLGFHIVQVIEREPQKLLEPDARRTLQEQLVSQWLVERRSQSEIEIFVPGYSE